MAGSGATILVAPDSFKGTFGAPEVAEALARGCEEGGARADRCPVADGGEGTAAVLLAARGGEWVAVPVHDPLGRPIEARFALLDDGELAVVDVAAASGLDLIAPAERDPWRASTRGTGELIRRASELGARRVLVAAGGSATVDGGAGAVEALREHPPPAGSSLTVLCDVTVPWERCAEIFGPQKGADPELVGRLSARLDELASGMRRDPRGVPMSGAAGGLSGALWAACDAELVAGAPFVFEMVGLERRLAAAAAVITGEGRLDAQSALGKVVGELSGRAVGAGVPLHAVVGSVAEGGRDLPGLASVSEAETLPEMQEAARQIALTVAGGRL